MRKEIIKLEVNERKELVNKIKDFFLITFETDLSDLKASMLSDYIIEELGPTFYNKALSDAHFLLSDKISDIYVLEKFPRK